MTLRAAPLDFLIAPRLALVQRVAVAPLAALDTFAVEGLLALR